MSDEAIERYISLQCVCMCDCIIFKQCFFFKPSEPISAKLIGDNSALTLYHTIPTFNDDPEKVTFWKHCWKSRCFLPLPYQISTFVTFILPSANALNLDPSPKFCCLVKGQLILFRRPSKNLIPFRTLVSMAIKWIDEVYIQNFPADICTLE